MTSPLELEINELEAKLQLLQARTGYAVLMRARRPTPPSLTYDRWEDVPVQLSNDNDATLADLVKLVLGEEPDPRLKDFLLCAEGDESAHITLHQKKVYQTPDYDRKMSLYLQSLDAWKDSTVKEIARLEEALANRELLARKAAKAELVKERAEYERLKAKFEGT